ncbi:MAG: YdjY domain-containing protein [Phycisphaerae bacterium]
MTQAAPHVDQPDRAPGGREPTLSGDTRPIEVRVAEFAPGVRIHWRDRVVEVNAVVVLRKGPLELLACSPRTREHESILAITARPLHVFQAMGLVGLEPGAPVRYDDKAARWHAPTGTPLRLDVRYERDHMTRTVPVHRWLHDTRNDRTLDAIDWVFAGSRMFPDGRFGADIDGTVACVVDFDTALITVGTRHTADNALLWLAAETNAIPPLGTRCTLLIRAAVAGPVHVELAGNGTFRVAGHTRTASDVARLAARYDVGADAQPDAKHNVKPDAKRDRSRVVLHVGADVGQDATRAAVARLVRAGIDRSLIDVRKARGTDPRPEIPGGAAAGGSDPRGGTP